MLRSWRLPRPLESNPSPIPSAVNSLWQVSSPATTNTIGCLPACSGQIKTKQASEMLSGIAVYSLDEKAHVAATQALATRNPDEFAGKLVSLLNHRLLSRVGEIDDGSGGRSSRSPDRGSGRELSTALPVDGPPGSSFDLRRLLHPGDQQRVGGSAIQR